MPSHSCTVNNDFHDPELNKKSRVMIRVPLKSDILNMGVNKGVNRKKNIKALKTRY